MIIRIARQRELAFEGKPLACDSGSIAIEQNTKHFQTVAETKSNVLRILFWMQVIDLDACLKEAAMNLEDHIKDLDPELQ